jgi:ArsR family transcriptional regulator, arsenate/arsenite/antimonite-responsive transcriptional repressor
MKTLPVLKPICCGPDVPPIDSRAARDLAEIFKALADPTRVAIVSRLASGEQCCVCDLTDTFELSQPTVSHHLRILREAGLVEAERRGTFAYYWLVPEAIDRLRGIFMPAALAPAQAIELSSARPTAS